jgi:hypothetical protein
MKETLETFIQNLKDEAFSQAHETMEQQWKIYKKEGHALTKLLKGYINGATAFELLRRDKREGAQRLWGVYEKYLPLLKEDIEEYALFTEADRMLQRYKEERLP